MENRNSGYGVASVAAGIVGAALTLVLTLGSPALQSSPSSDSSAASVLAADLLLVAFLILDVLAFGLGITGLLQRRCRKALAATGTALSSATLLSAFVAIQL